MTGIDGRNILLGITAGVAAYKAAELTRLLVKAGARVQVVMTPAAREFIAPLTLQALSGRPVRDSLFDPAHEAAMGHIALARWADLVVVAPATADCIAGLAAGRADSLLLTLCLATDAPLALAPAMNNRMWENPATRANVATLQQRGLTLLGPAEGEQACGETGPGRMLEPADIVAAAAGLVANGGLAGRRVLITAGPTREAIDPVRYVGNRSSGKMGFAIAAAARAAGAAVTLVAGPVALPTPGGVKRVNVETALQMHTAVMDAVTDCDLFIACAAVADYRPERAAGQKIKKDANTLRIDLVRNPDILADVAQRSERPFCVGFAAETEKLEQFAERKRRAKGVDMIAANRVGEGRAFGTDDNALLVLWEGGGRELPRQAKASLARALVQLIAERLDAQA